MDNRLHFSSNAHVAVSFPFRNRFMDVAGALTDELEDQLADYISVARFDDATGEVEGYRDDQDEETDHPVLQIAPYFTSWFLPRSGFEDGAFDRLWDLVRTSLRTPSVRDVAVRALGSLLYDNVQHAITAYRHTFFDYHAAPLLALGGTPTAASLTLKSKGIPGPRGMRIDGEMRIWPIKVSKEVLKDLEVPGDPRRGGWAFSAETRLEKVEAPEVGAVATELLSAARRLIAETVNRVQEDQHALGA